MGSQDFGGGEELCLSGSEALSKDGDEIYEGGELGGEGSVGDGPLCWYSSGLDEGHVVWSWWVWGGEGSRDFFAGEPVRVLRAEKGVNTPLVRQKRKVLKCAAGGGGGWTSVEKGGVGVSRGNWQRCGRVKPPGLALKVVPQGDEQFWVDCGTNHGVEGG